MGSSSVCSLTPALPLLFHTPHGLSLAHRAKKAEVGLIRLGGHLKIVGWRFSERSCSGATNKTTVSTTVQGRSHEAYALLREASGTDLP
jgi:hypothetical protein